MLTNDGYALLIGIDDYSAYDASRGQAVGTSDLRGSRNDVRTFWRLCRLIGIKPAHIRVLASPPIDWNELEGATPENVAPATEAEVLRQTAWLAGKLGHASKPTGILTYSGHGDWLAGEGLALCPSDVTWAGDTLQRAVSFRALNAHLAPHAENLTVLLDTCHSGAALADGPGHHAKTGRPLTLTRRPLASTSGHEDLAGRVVTAAARDQVAYQAMFDGQWRGVFSWAVSATIEQWRATQESGHNVRIDLSYGTLVETAHKLMSALWFKQTPAVGGPSGVADLAVLHHGLVAHAGETAAHPDGGFISEQLDPGGRDYIIYSISDGSGTQVGQVLVTATEGDGFNANTEYWYMTGNLTNTASYTFTAGTSEYWSSPPSGLGTLSFKMARNITWSHGTVGGTALYNQNPLTGEVIAITWNMTNTGGTWSGSITWWHSTNTNVFQTRTAGTSWTLSPKTVSRYSTYYYVSTPL